MRRAFFPLFLLLAAAAPVRAAAAVPDTRLLVGAGLAVLPSELGTEEERPLFGLGLSHRIQPRWLLEARGSLITKMKALSPGSVRRVAHGELNLIWTPLEDRAAAPYLTLGVGAAAVTPQGGASSETDFAWNGGGGVDLRLSRRLGLRVEGRAVGFRVPDPAGGQVSRVGTEAFAGFVLGLGVRPDDTDRDGVSDPSDACPDTPAGAHVDARGCPVDSDADGVADGLDGCADTPRGARVDASGCPADADGDGVFDGIDICPDTPPGARADLGGCPLDADADGVADGIDSCAETPKGCTVDAKGCPADADADGVCDGVDRCPGTPTGVKVDLAGCTATVRQRETQLLETGMIRLEDINFDTGKATLRPESNKALNEVGDILARWPELRIEIGGHTDSRGDDVTNQKLSRARAQAVRAYLLDKFPELDPGRFTAVGYGESQPVSENASELGRAQNRRVEFKVLNPEALRRTQERRINVPKE